RFLARDHELSDLYRQIESWKPQTSTETPEPLDWQPGSKWGQSTRIFRIAGICWTLQCPCGALFDASNNDTTPEHKRKCSTCQFADDLTTERQELLKDLDSFSKTLVDWH